MMENNSPIQSLQIHLLKNENGRTEFLKRESKTLKFGKIIDLRYPPNYLMGEIEIEFGKRYFFHKDNENPEVFNALEIGSPVSFLPKKTKKRLDCV